MIDPTRICSSRTSATTRKYLPMRRWLGVNGVKFASTGSIGAWSGSLRNRS